MSDRGSILLDGEHKPGTSLVQCRVIFTQPEFRVCCGADPLVCAGRPRPAAPLKSPGLPQLGAQPSHDGVRTPVSAGTRMWVGHVARPSLAPSMHAALSTLTGQLFNVDEVPNK
jgi:hypothetical protein